MMKKVCMNPYLPLDEFIPDGEPHVFGDRLYLFGSHDREHGSEFCELDYTLWSTSTADLSDWQCHGTIFRREQDPYNVERLPLYAPDAAQGPDGRYYLFYCIKFQDAIHVASADRPEGPYRFYGRVSRPDGRVLDENQPYDPSVLVTEEGIYLYYGFAPCMINIPRYRNQSLLGCSVVRLDRDMLTVLEGPTPVLPSLDRAKGTSFEQEPYFEAPSARKISGRYYLVYSSVNTHKLCYAVSDRPMAGFVFGGCIVSNGDVGFRGRPERDKLMSVGNNHGGLVKVEDQWYIFYHRHTGLTQYQRQGCAERVFFDAEGQIPQVSISTSGMNPGLLPGVGEIPAVYCCNLTNGHMGALSSLGRSNSETEFPYLDSLGGERMISAFSDGCLAGFKYFDFRLTRSVGIEYRADGEGRIELASKPEGTAIEELTIAPCAFWTRVQTAVHFDEGEAELYLRYHGSGNLAIRTLLLA